VVNGSFEDNPVPAGSHADVTNLPGWTSATGAVDVWRQVAGRPAGAGASMIAIDRPGRANSVEQAITTQPGVAYTLSFLYSPTPGNVTGSNKITVTWNGATIGSVSRNGKGLTTTSWTSSTFTVTGTGTDRLGFREQDGDTVGGYVDDVRLTR
jgi:hypothetical protein